MTDTTRQDPEDGRARIMRRSLEVFSSRGFDTVTVRQVAESAGVSPITVYRYFGSKHDLVLPAREATVTALLDAAREVPPVTDARSFVSGALLAYAEHRPADELWPVRVKILLESSQLQRAAASRDAEFEHVLVQEFDARTGEPSHAGPVAAGAGVAALRLSLQVWTGRENELQQLLRRELQTLWPDLHP